MRWKPERFSDELQELVASYDRKGAAALCDRLVDHLRSRIDQYPVESAKTDLQTLRNKRYFDLMSVVADAHVRAGLDDAQIRRQYAQSLLDQGNVTAALALLREIAAGDEVPASERAEARGLMGRAYKQVYVDAGDWRPAHNLDALLRAIDCYFSVYESDPERHLWQGINAAALLARARRDGVDTGNRPDPAAIAKSIRDAVLAEPKPDTWDLGTLSEAYVVLGDWKNAAKALERYTDSPGADAFEIGSTCRQFQEVWQLDSEEGEERVLLDLLRGELLRREGGGIELTPAQLHKEVAEAGARTEDLEALLSLDAAQSHTWLMDCLRRANGVARIRFGKRNGTGFLIPGGALTSQWAGKQILVTNNHVIATELRMSMTMRPNQAEVTFDALHGGGTDQPRYKVKGSTLFESPFDKLDTTCVELDRTVEGVEDFPLAEDMPFQDQRVYVIGHPMGRELSYSFQDNKLIAIDKTRMHYRSPTERGSSGSPLFNRDWELIGLHHAGSHELSRLDDPNKTYPANEGIPLPAIAAAVAAAVE